MPETRKNHLTIDGGQVKEDDHVSSYKPIPESDTGFRTSKSSITKSKEKLSADGAEEKLLQKEEEAKIIRVDMADAKYVVGDHRNGDAKIELDANKRQFSGLTKEELMKYAEDPFWVRLRWFMFIMFWTLWLCMLAGAIAIIYRAPKCYPPEPRTWYEKGPLVDMSNAENYKDIEAELPLLKKSEVAGVFTYVCKDTFEVTDIEPACIKEFKAFAAKAKDHGVKVIVDLAAGFVSSAHKWFQLSENRKTEFSDYFVWNKGGDVDATTNKPAPPAENNWEWSDKRGEYYFYQLAKSQPALNFQNPRVVKEFDSVIKLWMDAGAYGIRLHNGRQLVVNSSLSEVGLQFVGDQAGLNAHLAHWADLATRADGPTVFTLAEKASGENFMELFLQKRNTSALRPPSAVPIDIRSADVVKALEARLPQWPLLQLTDSEGSDVELAKFAMLVPAAPVLTVDQLPPLNADNDTKLSELFSHLVSLREDASVQHGNYSVLAAPARNSTQLLLVCARWKENHTGYAAVYNPGSAPASANLTGISALPKELTLYNVNTNINSDNVPVEGKSTVILSFVPKTTVEE